MNGDVGNLGRASLSKRCGRLGRYLERKHGTAVADAAITYLLLCRGDNDVWPPTSDYRGVTPDADPVSLSMTFYACQALLDAGIFVPHSPFSNQVLAGLASRRDKASGRYGSRLLLGDSHTFLQKPEPEIRTNLRHTAGALLTRHMLKDTKSQDFLQSIDQFIEDLNEIDREADLVGIAFSVELLTRMQSDGSRKRRTYDHLARRLIKLLLSPSKRTSEGLWNPHSFLGHGSIEDSALLIFSLRHAVTEYRAKFEPIIRLLRESQSEEGWAERPNVKSDLWGRNRDSISTRASIWAFGSLASLYPPTTQEWSWYVNFLTRRLSLYADQRAPLSVAEMSCVLSTLSLVGYVSQSRDRSFSFINRFSSIPGNKRERIADTAFATGWRQLRWLARFPLLAHALLRGDVSLLNRIALEWSPMLTLVSFVLAVVSVVLSVVALR